MIKKLRWKFILVAMVSMILILGIIVGTITLVNYNAITANADKILNVLANNDGTFDKKDPPDPNSSSSDIRSSNKVASIFEDTCDSKLYLAQTQEDNGDESQVVDDSNDTPQVPPSGEGGGPVNPGGDMGGNKETPFSTRYFSVIFSYDSSGTVSLTNYEVDTDNIAAITSDEALTMAKEVLSSNKTNGYAGVYRYLAKSVVKSENQSYIVVFVDCTNDLNSVKTFAINALWISACGIVAVFGIVTLLSYLVFAPVKKSYDKQKIFVTNAAHELKTPLTIISANNELIEAQYDSVDETQAIDKQVKKLTHMINNLNLLSKLDEKDGKLESFERIDLTSMTNELVESFESVLQVKNIKFEHNVESNVFLQGNGTMISQLLTLLMDNASKYALTYINFNIRNDGKYVVVESINDANINEENPEMLLERFYRSDKARGGSIEGSGIGLSIVKEIVNLHKGTIKIGAQNNTYSCFIRIKA